MASPAVKPIGSSSAQFEPLFPFTPPKDLDSPSYYELRFLTLRRAGIKSATHHFLNLLTFRSS